MADTVNTNASSSSPQRHKSPLQPLRHLARFIRPELIATAGQHAVNGVVFAALLRQIRHNDSRLAVSREGHSWHLALPDNRYAYLEHVVALEHLIKLGEIKSYAFIDSRGCFLFERLDDRAPAGDLPQGCPAAHHAP